MRSLSVSQIDKLGRRLSKAEAPDPADYGALQRLRLEYDPPMTQVQAALREKLGLETASRIKTETTIIEKLRRERTRLSTMQDIAGVRVVQDMSLIEQDELQRLIARLFPGARINDRRQNPSYGYRAVHIIVQVEDCSVEIQVRTHLQHLWAEIFEKLGDFFGREIRYGGEPVVRETSSLIRTLRDESPRIADLESKMAEVESLTRRIDSLPGEQSPDEVETEGDMIRWSLADLKETVESSQEQVRRRLETVLKLIGDIE